MNILNLKKLNICTCDLDWYLKV